MVQNAKNDVYSACETITGEEGKCKPLVLCAGRTMKDARENKCLIRSAEKKVSHKKMQPLDNVLYNVCTYTLTTCVLQDLYGICCSPRKNMKQSPFRTIVGRKVRLGGGKGDGGVVGLVLVNPAGQKGQGDAMAEAFKDRNDKIINKEGQKVEVSQIIQNLGQIEPQVHKPTFLFIHVPIWSTL